MDYLQRFTLSDDFSASVMILLLNAQNFGAENVFWECSTVLNILSTNSVVTEFYVLLTVHRCIIFFK